MDHGHKFVNEALFRWCQSKGMTMEMMAPYSPSQNGVAKWMNRTLEELARAIWIAADLPVFLWEQAIVHAAYL
jgi:transposase InsO family protein